MIFTATTALTYPHQERATAGLRGELRQGLLAAGVMAAPDWSRFTVSGPVEFTDGRGQLWFGYSGTIDTSAAGTNAE